jgi:hypothetical protein
MELSCLREVLLQVFDIQNHMNFYHIIFKDYFLPYQMKLMGSINIYQFFLEDT